MTNEEIQKHIEQNCRHEDGSPAMDEQAFYEGAKWMRDKALSLHNVVVQSELLNAFLDYSDKLYWGENDVTDRRQVIEQFIKRIQ